MEAGGGNGNVLLCRLCEDIVLLTPVALLEHLLSAHPSQAAVCLFCQRLFYSKQEYQEHAALHLHHREGYIRCPHCEFACLSRPTFSDHMAKHPDVPNNFLNGFALQSIAYQQITKTEGDALFKCSNCKNEFLSLESFVVHRIDCCNMQSDKLIATSAISIQSGLSNEHSIEFLSECLTDESIQNVADIPVQNIIYDVSQPLDSVESTTDLSSSQILLIDSNPMEYSNIDNSSVNITETDSSFSFINVPSCANLEEPELNNPVSSVKLFVKTKDNIVVRNIDISPAVDLMQGVDISEEYLLSSDDDPISEFLKMPEKSNIKGSWKSIPRTVSKVKTNVRKRQAIKMKKANKTITLNLAATADYSNSKDNAYIDKMIADSADDIEKEQVYLKETKTLNMLKCQICGQMFSNQHFMNQHIDVHAKYIQQNKYFCRYCKLKRFTKVTALIDHVAVKHKSGKLYKCSLCSKVFNKTYHFSTHIHHEHDNVSGQFKFDNVSGYIFFKIKQGLSSDESISNIQNIENDQDKSAQCVSSITSNNEISFDDEIENIRDVNVDKNIAENCESSVRALSQECLLEDSNVSENQVEKSIERDANATVSDVHLPNNGNSIEAISKKYGVILKNAVVVVEDIGKNYKNLTGGSTSLLNPRSRNMKKSTRSSKRKRRESVKKLFKKKGKKPKSKIVKVENLKKTNSNVIIKVRNPETINGTMKKCSDAFKFRCHFCSKRFKDALAFNLHIKAHFRHDTFLCICGVRLETKELFEEHKQKYHEKNSNADIVLINVKDDTCMFIQQGNGSILKGTLKRVNTLTKNPLKFTKLPENNEYMGDVTIKPVDNNYHSSRLKENVATGVFVKRLEPEEFDLNTQNKIKMTKAGEGIKALDKPFEIKSTFVSPDTTDNLYKGVTHVTKLPARKSNNTFELNYKTVIMPTEINEIYNSPVKKTYANRVSSLITDIEDPSSEVTLVSANPLAHLISDQQTLMSVFKPTKKAKKVLDYEAIIRKNLANLMTPKSDK